MKKQYINPQLAVVNVATAPLLAGSDPKASSNPYSGGVILSREDDVDDWED